MEKKLYRNVSDKVLAGVASGLAEYLAIDVTVIRIAFLLLFFFGGSGFLIYIIMWIVVPAKKNFIYNADYRVYEEPPYQRPPVDPNVQPRERSGNGRYWAGFALVIFGLYFLFYEFQFIPYWFNIGKLWPLIFIIPGVIILSNSRRRDESRHEDKSFTNGYQEKTTTDNVNTNSTAPTGSDPVNPPSSDNSTIDPNQNQEKI